MNGSCGLKMNGIGCSEERRSARSGFCTDGVCCAVACQGACVSCNQTGRLGTCWPIDQGVPDPRTICKDSGAAKCGQTGACDGFGACAKYAPETVCVLPSCAGTKPQHARHLRRAGDVQGARRARLPALRVRRRARATRRARRTRTARPGSLAQSHSCGQLTNGGACKAATDCASGYCVDGVCCNTACAGACRSCALASARGTCTPIAANSLDNRNVCKDQGVASCGTNGRCDGAGGCAKYATGTVCGGEKCARTSTPGRRRAAARGSAWRRRRARACPSPATARSASARARVTANCSTPNVCNGNSCGKKLNGAQCSARHRVRVGRVRAGLLLRDDLQRRVQVVRAHGHRGHVHERPDGHARSEEHVRRSGLHELRHERPLRRGRVPEVLRHARSARIRRCPAGTTTFTGQSTCDGAGKCVTPSATSCFPFACGAAVCNATCKSNADCANNATCINGSCGLQPKGGQCSTTANQCATGLVCSAQSVCCDAMCDGPASRASERDARDVLARCRRARPT